MNEQRLIKKISDQANIFKSRAKKSPEDTKRHDQSQPDEQKLMWEANRQLGWSFAKIGDVFNRDWRTVKQALKKYEAKAIEKSALQEHQGDIFDIIQESMAFTVNICNEKLDAANILYALRGKLTRGIQRYEVLGAITEHFGGSVVGEPVYASNEVFSKLSLLKIIDLQLRREGRPVAQDVGYWILTDFGKEVIQYLERMKK